MSESKVTLEELASLCKRRGFIYQGSDIYGGLAGTWDFGPLGAQLKRNITNLWWKTFVEDREDMYGLDAAILMNQQTWVASGHVAGFADPLVEDLKTKKRYRADHLLEDNGVDVKGMNLEAMTAAIKEKGIKSPEGNELSDVRQFNMMFKTHVGPVDLRTKVFFDKSSSNIVHVHTSDGESTITHVKDETSDGHMEVSYQGNSEVVASVGYLRPETAQGIFVNFKNVVDSFYPDLPFGIAQIGKAFRNEISPRDFIFRLREMEQMEIEYFVDPSKWEEAFEELRIATWAFYESLGLPKDAIHELEVADGDRAHYSKRTIDFEFDFPHGRKELSGLAYRTDYDLSAHQEHSGKSLEYIVKGTNAKLVPHVIEPSIGVERLFLAVIASSYKVDEMNGEKRIYLALPEHIAPVKFVVSPLLKNKPELVAKAREVFTVLKKKYGAVIWDDNGNIGKRYRRADEIGVPYCVVVDFESLEGNTKDTATVRYRDDASQKRVNIENL